LPALRLIDLISLQGQIKSQGRAATVGNYRKGHSVFQLINRKNFDVLVDKWGVDKGVRTFCTWEMTQALLCCFIMRLGSFREVEAALGIPDSTFGDALRKRYFGFFQELCDLILLEIRGKTESRKIKKAIRHIMAIDSSDIRVHGSLFDKPGWKQKHTIGHKAAAKLHVVWNVDGQWIDDFLITPGRRGDSPVSLELRLLPGKMYVFDRAYNDFDFWEKVVVTGSDFVTRLKSCQRNRALEKKILRGKKDQCGVLHDGRYVSTSLSAKKSKLKLRHIIYRDQLTKKIFHFVTSDQTASSKTVADIYKRRWAVELLFRWLKGHLDIRYLSTKTKNAVKTQLAVAVLVQLLLQLKKIINRFEGTLWDMLRQIRTAFVQKILAVSGPPDDCRWSDAIRARITL
jgi:putative transposase